MQYRLITGSMPGIAASTNETCEFGSPPKAVEALEKSFAFEVTWAWTSSPITTSHAPLPPLISFDLAGAFMPSTPGKTEENPIGIAGTSRNHHFCQTLFPVQIERRSPCLK